MPEFNTQTQLLKNFKSYFVDFMMLVSIPNNNELTDEMIDLHNSVLELEGKIGYMLVQKINLYGELTLTKKGDKIVLELLPLFVERASLH